MYDYHNAYTPDSRRYDAWLARCREIMEGCGLPWKVYGRENWRAQFERGRTPDQATRAIGNSR